MQAFAAVAVLVFAALVILFRQWRSGRGSAQFVLSVVPLALLFVIVPIPLSAVRTVREFQALAAGGHAGAKEATALALGIARPLWLGSLAFLVVVTIAGGLQVLASHLDRQRKAASSNSGGRRRVWGNRTLLASSLLVIPVAILSYLMQTVATLTMRAGTALTRSVEAQGNAAGMDPSTLGELISSRLLLAGFLGFPLILAVIVVGVGDLFADRFSVSTVALSMYSWALFLAVSILAAWNVIELASSIRVFDDALN
jgi:hypothetical protein